MVFMLYVIRQCLYTLTPESPRVPIRTTRFNNHKLYVLPAQCICVFCVDLRTNSDYFTVQHELTGFYNWDGVCLLQGTFYPQCIYVSCVDLRTNSNYFTVQHELTGFYNRWSVFTGRYGTFCPHSVFMCFVWIWEQTAIISQYNINWLVFITETECVYWAVRSAHSVFMCFVWIWEQTAIISLYSINWLVFITETECVYCTVRNKSLHVLEIRRVRKIAKSKLLASSCLSILPHWKTRLQLDGFS
jgi:hypothetical protein